MTDLREIVDAYLDETGMAPSAFGRDVMRNPNFVFDLRNGQGWNSRTYKKVTEWIANQRQQGNAA